ncbi:MAG: chorismate-binding protein, partial [Promicromonosporaceae bacterium]|nr:chorismate-binding protein [Promicromonosporaceae bacterium]
MSHRVSLRGQAFAQFAGRRATNVIECVDVLAAPERLREGLWFVVADFAGQVRAWRFAKTASADPAILTGSTWQGPPADSWASSMSQDDYELAVRQVQQRITVGEIAQVNVCRVLSAGLPRDPMHGLEPDAAALAATLATGNPAPYAGAIHVPGGIDGVESVWVVTASPESYLSLSKGSITSSPMKGTARTPEGLTAKDRTENMLVTDAVREEVALICEPGTTQVKDPLRVEQHPGLVQLVSVVGGRLR